MIDEEYDLHNCKPEIRDSRTIKCSDHYIIKDKNGRTVIGIIAFNGISYEFLETPEDKEHTKIPYQPNGNTKNYQPKKYQSLKEQTLNT